MAAENGTMLDGVCMCMCVCVCVCVSVHLPEYRDQCIFLTIFFMSVIPNMERMVPI